MESRSSGEGYRVVRLIGGPADGGKLAVSRWVLKIYCPRIEGPAIVSVAYPISPDIQPCLRHVYVRTGTTTFHHAGVQGE